MSARVHAGATTGPARAGSGGGTTAGPARAGSSGAAGSGATRPIVVVRLQDPGEVGEVSSEHSSIRSSRSSIQRRLAVNAEHTRIAQLELERLALEAELSNAGSQSSRGTRRSVHAGEPSCSAAAPAAGLEAGPARAGSSSQPGDSADTRSARAESGVGPAIAATGKCETTNPEEGADGAARAASVALRRKSVRRELGQMSIR